MQVVEGISSLQDEHRGVQLGTQAEECGLDHEEVGMDVVERIKAAYDKMKGNPSAMEDYIVKRLTDEAFREKPMRVVIPEGYKVIFEYDDGHVKDMRFERIH